jgi:hypothetical protein
MELNFRDFFIHLTRLYVPVLVGELSVVSHDTKGGLHNFFWVSSLLCPFYNPHFFPCFFLLEKSIFNLSQGDIVMQEATEIRGSTHTSPDSYLYMEKKNLVEMTIKNVNLRSVPMKSQSDVSLTSKAKG